MTNTRPTIVNVAEPQVVFPAQYQCTVIFCNGSTSCNRYRFCPEHSEACRGIGQSKVFFGMHKSRTWNEVLLAETGWVEYIFNKTDRYDTKPGDTHHERNKIVRGYVDNEVRAISLEKKART